jgi:hypothetical protein
MFKIGIMKKNFTLPLSLPSREGRSMRTGFPGQAGE